MPENRNDEGNHDHQHGESDEVYAWQTTIIGINASRRGQSGHNQSISHLWQEPPLRRGGRRNYMNENVMINE
jgi:hypothetical protein